MNKFIRLHDIGYQSTSIYDSDGKELIYLDRPRFVIRGNPIDVIVNPDLVEEVMNFEGVCKKVVYEKVRLGRFGFFYKNRRRVAPFLTVPVTFVRLVSGKGYFVRESIDELENMVKEATR